MAIKGAQPAYLTTGQAARLLGVAKNTLLRAVRLGEIRVARQMPGGALRFLRADVDAYAAFLASRRQGVAATPVQHAGMDESAFPGAEEAMASADPAPLHAGLERLARVAAGAESGVDGLIADILTLLADSLHVGLTFLARADALVWRLDWVHDRVGMGLAPGATMPLWEICREALLTGAGSPFIVEDVQNDVRVSAAVATQARGIGSYTAVPLHRPDGRLFGALCTLHPRARAVPDGEIALLRLAGHIVAQAVEAEALRQRERRLLRHLAASEERYRRIVETAQEGIVMLDPTARLTYLNQRMASMLGYTVEEMRGEEIFSYMDEALATATRIAYDQQRRQSRELRRFDARLRHKDGADIWVLASSVALSDDEGQFAGELVMMTDITARKQAEENLRQSEEQYRRIVETAQEGIVQADADNIIVYANRKLAEMLGYMVEELLGRPLIDLAAEDARGVVAANQQRRREGYRGNYLHELKLRTKGGADLWVMASSTPTFDEEGRFTGGTALLMDITTRPPQAP